MSITQLVFFKLILTTFTLKLYIKMAFVNELEREKKYVSGQSNIMTTHKRHPKKRKWCNRVLRIMKR